MGPLNPTPLLPFHHKLTMDPQFYSRTLVHLNSVLSKLSMKVESVTDGQTDRQTKTNPKVAKLPIIIFIVSQNHC